MRRYLLVLDMDLLGMDPLALDEELGQEPINYLVVQQEQQPCEVVVCPWWRRGGQSCQR